MRRLNLVSGVSFVLYFSAHAALAADMTLTLVPVGGTSVVPGGTVALEAFMTTNIATRHEGGSWDLPCTVAAQPGGSGTLTATGGCTDCDMNGSNTSVDGTAFLFGPAGLSPHNAATCSTFTTPAIGAAPPLISAGVTRYLGTINYQVSDCAAGSFLVSFECTDLPGGVCDDIPEPANTTRYREDEPVQPQAGPLLSLDMVGVTLTAEAPGSCCTNSGTCLGDGVTETCCLNTLGGDHWHAGLLCSDPEPCSGTLVESMFTYQGFLEKPAGTPLTDTCTIEFKLCDHATDTCAPATISTHPGIVLTNGVFTVPDVDFGADAFTGKARWMDVYVQCTGDVGLVALAPRVALSPAPQAIRALRGVGAPNTIEIDLRTRYVGVGTASPAEKLHVVGNAEVDGTLFADAVSSNSPLLLQTTGTTRIYADDVTGNVGIGTTTPANKLDVAGGAAVGATYSGTSAAPTNGMIVEGNVGIGTAIPSSRLHVESSGTATIIAINNTAIDGDPQLRFQLGGASTFSMGVDDGDGAKFKIGTSALGTLTRLAIDSTGNVGIGTNAPAMTLDVNGAAFFEGNSLYLRNPAAAATTQTWGMVVNTSDGSLNIGDAPDAPSEGLLSSTKMAIERNGNVGVGTTAPSGKLHVVDGLVRIDEFGDYAQVRCNGTGGTSAAPTAVTSGAGLARYAAGGYDGTTYSPSRAAMEVLAAENWTPSAQGTTLRFTTTTNGGVSGGERMRISDAGFVGIGDSAPSVALDVVGDINYTGTITDVSDGRLKENITPLRNALAKALQLDGVYFTMKDTPGEHEVGLLAQNVQRVLPEAVRVVDLEAGYLGVSYPSVIPLLVEAIKELHGKIAAADTEVFAAAMQELHTIVQEKDCEIAELDRRERAKDQRINDLEARLAALEARIADSANSANRGGQ